MGDSGRKLDWHERLVVDKHCIGGIPGNQTSMLAVPILAAHGLFCPKTSSRAITSPVGTADTLEVLANVDLPGCHRPTIAARRQRPLLIGPDQESVPWVARAAARHGFDNAVCRKTRHGDRAVVLTLPDVAVAGRQVVLLDDVASTGHTLAQTAA